MKKLGLILLFGIFFISLVSGAPVISDITIEPEQPIVSEDVKICANITDEVSEIVIVRINLHSENPLWNWGLLMYEEGDNYCRTLSPQLMKSYEGMEVSYYISARNSLGESTIDPTNYFNYTESIPEPEEPEPEPEETQTSSGHTSNIDQSCSPSWECERWSSCDNGVIRRSCYDRNHCSYSYNKPNEVAGCDVSKKVFVDGGSNDIFLLVGGVLTMALLGILIGVLARR